MSFPDSVSSVQLSSRWYLCAWKSPYMLHPDHTLNSTPFNSIVSEVSQKFISEVYLRSFPNSAFETVPMFVWFTMALSHPFNKNRLAFPHSTPLSSRWPTAWCPQQVISQALHHFRSSKIQAICVGCFAHRSICSVIFLHSSMSRAVHPLEFSKVDVDHWHIPVWASHFTFYVL